MIEYDNFRILPKHHKTIVIDVSIYSCKAITFDSIQVEPKTMEDLTTLNSDKHSPEHFQINMRQWDYYMMMQKLKNDALWCKSAKNLAICIIYEASINLWCDLTTLIYGINPHPCAGAGYQGYGRHGPLGSKGWYIEYLLSSVDRKEQFPIRVERDDYRLPKTYAVRESFLF